MGFSSQTTGWIRTVLRLGLRLAQGTLLFALIYILVLGAMQRRLIYHPTILTSSAYLARVQASTQKNPRLTSARLMASFDALVIEPKDGKPIEGTAILFHGNGGLGLDRDYLAPEFLRQHLRLVLAEYPGFGRREGEISQEALVKDAQRLYEAVTLNYGDPVTVVGESLGSGVAVQIAARNAKVARLVLITPFMSLTETAALRFPVVLVKLLLRDTFDSATALTAYRGPVAILIAGADEVVGAAQGHELAAQAQSRGETLVIEKATASHNTWAQALKPEEWSQLLGKDPDCACTLPNAPVSAWHESALLP